MIFTHEKHCGTSGLLAEGRTAGLQGKAAVWQTFDK